MANKRHRILKNEFGTSLRFNRTRGVDDSDDSIAERDYSTQKNRLQSELHDFNSERNIRRNLRDTMLDVTHLDAISIDFLKMVDANFARVLERRFGLSAMSFSNFNQMVCFAISDENRFFQNFENELLTFVNTHANNVPAEYKILTTIQDFRFVSASKIRQEVGLNTLTENIIIKLYEDHVSTINIQHSIHSKLIDFLTNRNIQVSKISDTIFQIDYIPQNDLEYIINNFDVIQSIQGLRYLRIVPNEYGDTELGMGLNINLRENAPIIAVLDTGIADDPILRPILCNEGIDLTSADNQPYKVDSDHGTTVACLASFGDSYFNNDGNNLYADAKVFSIKYKKERMVA